MLRKALPERHGASLDVEAHVDPASICAFVIGFRGGKRCGAMERAASGVRAASEAMLIEMRR